MEKGTTQLLLNLIDFKCPLCSEKFRLKFTLRHHINRNHTQLEAEKYLKIITKRL